jgi:hypothetical protein
VTDLRKSINFIQGAIREQLQEIKQMRHKGEWEKELILLS